MNKRYRKLQRSRQLFLYRGTGDCNEYDTFDMFLVAARDPAHAVRLIVDNVTWRTDPIEQRVEECLSFGLPIPKDWEQYLTDEVKKKVWNDQANWTFEKITNLPGIQTPQVLGKSFNAG